MLPLNIGVYILPVSISVGKHQSFVGDKESPLIFTSKTAKQKTLPISNFGIIANQTLSLNLSIQVRKL